MPANVSNPMVRRVMQHWFRWTRSMTLGVRAMVIDEREGILLVRHGYVPGWLLPGGGIERGETAHQALARELQEEAAITLTAEPELFGLYSNEKVFRGDHVALYVVKHFLPGRFEPSVEITEARFFDPNSLPEDTSEGTRRRVDEVFRGRGRVGHW
jgi:ADP-ribose pyrophosphatase YjhB (NUDIX family)